MSARHILMGQLLKTELKRTYKDVNKAYIDGTTLEDRTTKDIQGCQQDIY